MLILSILLLLISNAVTSRRDKSILFSRSSLSILVLCFFICFNSFDLKLHEKGLGLYSGFLQTTAISHAFHIFVFLVTLLILQLNGFYPRKISTEKLNSYFNAKALFFKLNSLNNFILNKMSEQYRIIEYSLIILFVLIGGVFLMSSSDLISIFISLELQSYALYILCVIYRDSERATSGGLTYFLLGGLSSCFILLAFGLLYGNSGNTGYDGLYTITNISSVKDNVVNGFESLKASLYQSYYLNFSLTIMSIGFLFKISAAPFHFWSPDVYDAIPTIVTTFVAVFAKISILILLLELVHFTTNYFSPYADLVENQESSFFNFSWTFTLLVSSFLSLIVGAVLGLTQFRVKRLYAYSTISHLGFILLALSVNSIESIQSFIFYLMQYSITNLNAFILLIGVGYSLYLYVNKNDKNSSDSVLVYSKPSSSVSEKMEEKVEQEKNLNDKNNSPIQLLSEMKGYFFINPYLALSLALTLFSFVGIPPLMGFFAKQMVLSSALDNGYIFMVLVAILTSVISAFYYLMLVKQIFFDKTDYIINPSLETINLKTSISLKEDSTENKKDNARNQKDEVNLKGNSSNNLNEIIINKNNIQLSSSLTVTVSILTLIILLFILIPQEWLNMATILALILFNT